MLVILYGLIVALRVARVLVHGPLLGKARFLRYCVVADPRLAKRLFDVFIEVLLARFAEKALTNPLVENFPTFRAATMNPYHLVVRVIETIVKELGHDVRIAK